MRIGHFLYMLQPNGMNRVVEALLKYSAPSFREQFVVTFEDGPMRSVFEGMGFPVHAVDHRDPDALVRILSSADMVNLHLWHPDFIPGALAGPFHRPKVITLHAAERFRPEMADWFIATSQAAHRLQPDTSRCELIPNGIDLERFDGHRMPLTDPRVICRVCRPSRCDEFFWYGVLPVLADYSDTELWLAGSDVPSTRRVRALGASADVADVLASASVFVYTPRPGEGTKDLTVMEAMAMGLPCILADVPAVRESAWDESTAVLVPFGDAVALGANLRRLLDDPQEAERLGRSAREHALVHFDVRPSVASYEAVYERLA